MRDPQLRTRSGPPLTDAEASLAGEPESDRWLLLITLLLLGAGLVMVLSASQALAYLDHRTPLYYFERQVMWAVIGLMALVFFAQLDYHRLRPLAAPLALASALGMLAVLVPHIGIQVNGARRWLPLGPLGEVQPSEVSKLAFAIYLAHWIDKRGDRIQSFWDGFIPLCFLGAIAIGLTLLQKDLGSALVIASIFASSFFIGGGRKRYMLLLVVGLVAVFAVMVVIEPYRAARLTTFTDPFSNRLVGGWQSTQALFALGTGGITGVGLGHSVEKFLWLPEAHTDFIFAIVGEETGLLGTTALLAAFVAFTVRCYRVALRASDRFGLVLAASITSWVAFQALINMATVTDTLPITGVTLPFISYGGTSLATTLAAVGVLLSISGQGDRRSYLDNLWRKNAALDLGRRHRRAPVSRARRRAGLSG